MLFSFSKRISPGILLCLKIGDLIWKYISLHFLTINRERIKFNYNIATGKSGGLKWT